MKKYWRSTSVLAENVKHLIHLYAFYDSLYYIIDSRYSHVVL